MARSELGTKTIKDTANEWDRLVTALDAFEPVLHYDADFDLIASVTAQRCQWVVPAGTLD